VLPFLRSLLVTLLESLRDLLPVIAVVAFFQLFVLRQPLPESVSVMDLVSGLLLVVAGLTLFVRGLQLGLFPIGEQLAHEFVSKSSVAWLLTFAFALGFGTTVAEPALLAVAAKAAEAMADAGSIAAGQ
jgi:ABC-type nickel/cobalt efflux system permease component RcnA